MKSVFNILTHQGVAYKTLLEKDPQLFWKSLKDNSTLPFTPQEALYYCTKMYTFGEIVCGYFVLNSQLSKNINKRGSMVHYESSKLQSMTYMC